MPVDEDDLELCLQEVQPKSDIPCSILISELCDSIIQEYHLPKPDDPWDMYELYIFLRTAITRELA